VSRCATERVTVLNPASFGKLVRVLYPGLKTRRLGVRGESKYHYVNFHLEDDQPQLSGSQNNAPAQNFNDPGFTQSLKYVHPLKTAARRSSSSRSMPSNNTQFSVDRATFPVPEVGQMLEQQRPLPKPDGFIKPQSLYSQPVIHDVSQLDSTTKKMAQRLRFAPVNDPSSHEFEAISLPRIEPFVPTGTDPDSAVSLSALYRSHCTSLIEDILSLVHVLPWNPHHAGPEIILSSQHCTLG